MRRCCAGWRGRSRPRAPSIPTRAPGRRPAGFLGGALFQLVNPKGWLVCASASATFLDGRAGVPVQAAGFGLLFLVVCLPSGLLWLAFGAVVRRALRSPRAQRAFNLAMAALLAASVLLFALPA